MSAKKTADYNNDERDFACYIDEYKALKRWHRNVARAGQYCVQGWRKNKVYPDFLFALAEVDGKERLVVWETKGDQLAGNLDTNYKRKLLEKMTAAFATETTKAAGQVEIATGKGVMVQCDLVLMSEWKSAFGNLQPASP